MDYVAKTILFIRSGHVLTPFARSLCGARGCAELKSYRDMSELQGFLIKAPPNSKIVFYSPEIFLPWIILKNIHKFRFFYFLHEPIISLSRAPSLRFFLAYKAWLFLLGLLSSFIFLSEHGKREFKKTLLSSYQSTDKRLVIPLVINRVYLGSVTKLQIEKKFDFVMWGSLNKEKGLDRFIQTAKDYPNFNFGILARSNAQLKDAKKKYTFLKNISWDLRDCFISDGQINQFILSAKSAYLCQRQSTQSAQLSLALALRVPVFATDCGSFGEFLRGTVYSKCFPNDLSDEDLSEKVARHATFVFQNYDLASKEANSLFKRRFDATNEAYETWSDRI